MRPAPFFARTRESGLAPGGGRSTVGECVGRESRMRRKAQRTCLALAVAGLVGVGSAGAQQPSNEDLKKDIQALQESLKAIQKDLQDIKGMLTRQAPPPSGIGAVIDFGTSPTKGEQTAKLTLVEFSDYQ